MQTNEVAAVAGGHHEGFEKHTAIEALKGDEHAAFSIFNIGHQLLAGGSRPMDDKTAQASIDNGMQANIYERNV
jgi:hypothetical protein